MRLRVVLEFAQHPVVQVSPFADGLALLITLLPAVQAVLGSAVLLLLGRDLFLHRILRLQTPLERIEHLWDVVVELRTRQVRRGRQLRVGLDRALPGTQNAAALY